MLFNSIQFFIFFVVVTVTYFVCQHRYRWLLLLLASCVFYAAFIPAYLLVLFFTIIIDYIAGILIENGQGHRRKQYLYLSLFANIGVLAFFKYFNFFIDNINFLFERLSIATYPISYLSVILPIGLSFHTFQAMSYTIEAYRGNQKAERHFGIYSLYVMFYPQLVAGPIERPQNMLPQFHEKKYFNSLDFISGLQQMAWGLFKKVVVADQLSIYVNSIYNNWEVNSGLTLIIATYAFAFQIYCDFSGYSDIAQGAARAMGFNLMTNFSRPYFSRSITEFWRRWHISLSSWLRDYLYISLGGNRKGKWNTYRNLMLTMILGGLWHGASWNLVIWGFLNGLYLGVEKMLGIDKRKSHSIFVQLLFVFLTFNLICVTWIFFRAQTFDQATGIFTNIFVSDNFFIIRIQDTGVFGSMCLGLIILVIVELWMSKRKPEPEEFFAHQATFRSVGWIAILTLLIVLFGVSDGDQFIYFQF